MQTWLRIEGTEHRQDFTIRISEIVSLATLGKIVTLDLKGGQARLNFHDIETAFKAYEKALEQLDEPDILNGNPKMSLRPSG